MTNTEIYGEENQGLSEINFIGINKMCKSKLILAVIEERFPTSTTGTVTLIDLLPEPSKKWPKDKKGLKA